MAPPDAPEPTPPTQPEPRFNAAQIGALAHLYRGEVYRSTVWRTRLDSTTNWAVVTTGIALSATFSNMDASPLPMVLVGLLVCVFLLVEARRYRYSNAWHARARLFEVGFYAPMLEGEDVRLDYGWAELLAKEYTRPSLNIGFARAIGRRLRRTYGWILMIQAVSYYGKLAIHPAPLVALDDVWARAAIGPIPGKWVVAAGVLFHCGWVLFALVTFAMDKAVRRRRRRPT